MTPKTNHKRLDGEGQALAHIRARKGYIPTGDFT